MKILSVLARHGTTKYPDAQRNLVSRLDRQLPGVRRDLVIVDNALPPGEHESGRGYVVIGGDNSAWEFSAFDAGVAYASERLDDYDFIHFATSAFEELYTAYLNRFNEPVLRVALGRAVCLCHIDCYNSAITVLGRPSQHWARTSFVMLPSGAVRRLKSLVSVQNPAGIFSGDPQQPFRPDAPLSPAYRRYIQQWLTGADVGQNVIWHSPVVLTQSTLPLFEQKTLAILNEHLLSIRLRAMGCILVDVTWLSTLLATQHSIQWQTPWRSQLAQRDRDALLANST